MIAKRWLPELLWLRQILDLWSAGVHSRLSCNFLPSDDEVNSGVQDDAMESEFRRTLFYI